MQPQNPQLNSSVSSDSSDASNKVRSLQKLPIWSKLLIAMSGATLVFVGFFLFGFADALHKIAIDSVEPSKIAIVAKQIATFHEPLPEGYSFQAAYAVGQKVLIVKHKDGQTITFICNPYLGEDSKKGLEHASQQSLMGRAFFLPFSREKSRGELIVGGQNMPYLVGDFGSKDVGSVIEGLIGCVSLKKEDKTIFINALPSEGSSYNQKVTTDLLQSIENFEGTK